MTGNALAAALNKKYPQVHLSFGYLGNCGTDRCGFFDHRSWYFFTNVQGLRWGGNSTAEVGILETKAELGLEAWLIANVLPHAEHARWTYRVVVDRIFAERAEKLLAANGASFCVRSSNYFVFTMGNSSVQALSELLAVCRPLEIKLDPIQE